MLAKKMLSFRKYVREQGMIFCYSGYLTEEILKSVGQAIRQKLANEGLDKKTARTIFAIFVEQAQNIIRYSAEYEKSKNAADLLELRNGVITVGYEDEKYFIACANLIAHKDVDRLNTALGNIKGLDAEGLKTLYKETLKGEIPEGSKGAGVGFIDIARKAPHGFDFDFTTVDDDHSYFCIKAFV